MGLVALLGLSPWCLMVVGRLFLAVPWGCLRVVIVVFPDRDHLLFFLVDNCFQNFHLGGISADKRSKI